MKPWSCHGGPMVRIRLPPAASLLRTAPGIAAERTGRRLPPPQGWPTPPGIRAIARPELLDRADRAVEPEPDYCASARCGGLPKNPKLGFKRIIISGCVLRRREAYQKPVGPRVRSRLSRHCRSSAFCRTGLTGLACRQGPRPRLIAYAVSVRLRIYRDLHQGVPTQSTVS